MFNVTKWMKEGFEFTKGGEKLVESLTNLFKDNEEIITKSSTSIVFKNGARMIIKMSHRASEAVAKEAAK